MENKGLGMEEARKIIGISYPTMLQLVKSEGFPAFKVGVPGGKGKWIIPREQLMAWLEKQAGGGAN